MPQGDGQGAGDTPAPYLLTRRQAGLILQEIQEARAFLSQDLQEGVFSAFPQLPQGEARQILHEMDSIIAALQPQTYSAQAPALQGVVSIEEVRSMMEESVQRARAEERRLAEERLADEIGMGKYYGGSPWD